MLSRTPWGDLMGPMGAVAAEAIAHLRDDELNTPEMWRLQNEAVDAWLLTHGWSREEWRAELHLRQETSRREMLDRIAALTKDDPSAEVIDAT